MKVLIMGAGSPHNDYTGVDGLSNFRIPFSIRMQEYVQRRSMKLELYWANLNEPHTNPSVQNSVLTGMGYEDLKYLFVKQMMAIPISLSECKDEIFDAIIVELRPDTRSLRYPFAEQSRRIREIINWHLMRNRDCRITLWDMDGWAADWMFELEEGAQLAVNYENVDPRLKELNTQIRKIPLYSWMLGFFRKELEILDETVDPQFDIIYCGNVYGREKHMIYLDGIGDKYRVYVTGNWVRDRNHETVRILDKITFIGQSNHWLTIPLMHQSFAAIIIGNDKHLKSGLIACRVFEAAVAGCPMIVDAQYDEMSDAFKDYPNTLKFHDTGSLLEILEDLKKKEFRKSAIYATQQFALSQYDFDRDIKWLLGL